MKKIEIERYRFKRKVWSNFCSKDYPKTGLSDSDFLKIILYKAKKAYLRYVSFYTRIPMKKNGATLSQLKTTANLVYKDFEIISEVQKIFRQKIESIDHRVKYDEMVIDFENFSFFIWKDILNIEKQSLLPAA